MKHYKIHSVKTNYIAVKMMSDAPQQRWPDTSWSTSQAAPSHRASTLRAWQIKAMNPAAAAHLDAAAAARRSVPLRRRFRQNIAWMSYLPSHNLRWAASWQDYCLDSIYLHASIPCPEWSWSRSSIMKPKWSYRWHPLAKNIGVISH